MTHLLARVHAVDLGVHTHMYWLGDDIYACSDAGMKTPMHWCWDDTHI